MVNGMMLTIPHENVSNKLMDITLDLVDWVSRPIRSNRITGKKHRKKLFSSAKESLEMFAKGRRLISVMDYSLYCPQSELKKRDSSSSSFFV